MTIIPTYTTPIPAFDLLDTLNSLVNQINANFAQAQPATFSGTFIANGASAVTVANTNILATDTVAISLNTVGGTVGVQPHLATLTAGTGFTVSGTASDTSTYNYKIIRGNI